MDLIEKLSDEIKAAQGFCYLRDKLNTTRSCEVAVMVRVRIAWVRFRECCYLEISFPFPHER